MFKFNPEHPLGLPEGSVRAILVVMVVATYMFLVLTGKTVPPNLEALTEWCLGGYGILRVGTMLLKNPTPNPPGPPAQGEGA